MVLAATAIYRVVLHIYIYINVHAILYHIYIHTHYVMLGFSLVWACGLTAQALPRLRGLLDVWASW